MMHLQKVGIPIDLRYNKQLENRFRLTWRSRKTVSAWPERVTRNGSDRKTRRMLPRRECVVREKRKSGINTVTEVLFSL